MPLYLQVLRGRTALQSGLILMPLAIAAGLVNPIAGRLFDKIGPRSLVVAGSLVLLVNSWQFAHLTTSTPIGTIVLLLALRGISISLIMQATFTTALGVVPHRSTPRASSLVNSTRFIARALGVALLATVLGALARRTQRLEEEPNRQSVAAGSLGPCESRPSERNRMRANDEHITACDDYLGGLRRAYTVTFYATVVALVTGAFLPGWPAKWTGRREAVAA